MLSEEQNRLLTEVGPERDIESGHLGGDAVAGARRRPRIGVRHRRDQHRRNLAAHQAEITERLLDDALHHALAAHLFWGQQAVVGS